MSLLSVNADKCIKCGICVKACPVSIIEFENGKGYPTIAETNEPYCVVCGHCESVCPQFAIQHALGGAQLSLPAENAYISPTSMGAYFRNRRSIRNYLQKPVEKSTVEQIMNIVRYAPTGTNQQQNRWIVVQSKNTIQQLAQGTIDWMKSIQEANPEMAKRLNFQGLIASFEGGADVICRRAPLLIIGYADASYSTGVKDVVIATSHLELLLPSFGLGGCWAGYLMVALMSSPETKK